jgi:hypothetical protein
VDADPESPINHLLGSSITSATAPALLSTIAPALPYYTPSLALIGAWADAAGFRPPAGRHCRPFFAPRSCRKNRGACN